jgi:chemotaxis protein CheD
VILALAVVGIADCRVVQDPDCTLVTYALGSCVAVALHDMLTGVGGLLHFLTPNPDTATSAVNPFSCGQTGIPVLINQMLKLGAHKRRLSVYLAGGAQMLDQTRSFNVGKRNYAAARYSLLRAGLTLTHERVGGHVSRTVGLDIATGLFWVQEEGFKKEFLQRTATGSR